MKVDDNKAMPGRLKRAAIERGTTTKFLIFVTIMSMMVIFLNLALSRTAVSQANVTPMDPYSIPKYVDQLPVPPTLQPTTVADGSSPTGFRDDYTISMEQTTQQILPTGMPTTNIFAYTANTAGGPYSGSPGGVIKATRNQPVRVNWVNNLTTFDHPFMPVDPTLDWANPTGFVVPGTSFILFPPGYPQAQTPVPAAPTLHGGEMDTYSAGSPNQWFTNNAADLHGAGLIPGTNYMAPNTATFNYPNQQQAATLWYHDNAQGVSRLSQYSGLYGFYEITDPALTVDDNLPTGAYDIPLAIQDVQFNVDGTLAYPLGGPNPQQHPYWAPEFYGDVIVVNGKAWPDLNVERRQYRFRVLNSSSSRFLTLSLNNGMSFTQIGTDGGFLPNPVVMTATTLAPGERADILIDFSGQAAGAQIIMENTALTPFPLGPLAPNPDTNGQVMRFTVGGAVTPTPALPFNLNTIPVLTPDSPVRTMTINEAINAQTAGPVGLYINGQPMAAAAGILPSVGSTEEWDLINLSANAVPLRLPLVQFKLLNREGYDSIAYANAWYQANGVDPLTGMQGPLAQPTVDVPVVPYLLPPAEAPLPEELGWKDTIQVQPAEVTRILVRYAPQDAVGAAPNVNTFPFDPTVGPGYFVQSSWPSAADNEMTRPMQLNAGAPVLQVSKTVANLTNPGLDASPGDTLEYTITVTNNGAGAANNVVVTDPGPNDTSAPNPAGPYSLGNIAGGGAFVQQTYQVTVNNPLSFGTQVISNTATVTADNHVAVTATASINANQLPPLLGLAKSVSDASGDLIAQQGEVLTYTLTVSNTGPGDATNVTISDPGPNNTSAPNPAGPYNVGTVTAGGGTAQVVYTVTVDASVPSTVAAINNIATVSADNHGPETAMATIRNSTSDLSPLSSLAIPKYVDEIVKPPTWVPTSTDLDGTRNYDISLERFQQQILPSVFPATTVFGYKGMADLPGGPAMFQNSPGGTFEEMRGTASRVNWTNNIESQFLPVDPTIHWADPNNFGHPSPPFEAYPPGYPEVEDTVPTSTHLHGGEVEGDDDGGPESWVTSNDIVGPDVQPANHTGFATLTTNYPNSQLATTLWYHDHGLGITRINVLSGLAGFYLLRDPGDTIAPSLPSGNYEMPIVIQDRSFNTDGTLAFPLGGPNPHIHPYWGPEFFGDTIMVNGKTWPKMTVEPRRYRLRLLNGSNARFYTLELSNGMPFTQIGTDGGYLPHPVQLTSLTLAPAERADILVDFTNVPPGTSIVMTNAAPAPFPLGALPDPRTTGQIMQFTVQNVAPTPPPALPFELQAIPKLVQDSPTRTITLNESLDLTTGAPIGVFIDGQPWSGAVSELPEVGSTEMWEFVNLTADTHPIHLHLVQFQIVNREVINSLAYDFNWNVANGLDPSVGLQGPLDHPTNKIPVTPYLIPNPVQPAVNEQGWKDTIMVPPGMVTRILVRYAPQDAVGASPGVNLFPFDPSTAPGYVFHCHILDHEDNEMMRRIAVQPADPGKHYFWTWFDSINMKNWVLMSNPDGAPNLPYTLSIGNTPQVLPDLFGAGAGVVTGGNTLAYTTPGTMKGPVIANSINGTSAMVSQRTLMGSSFDEVLGTEKGKLSDHFYWTWYDMLSAGFTNWIMVQNPSATDSVNVNISFRDFSSGSPVTVSDTRTIPPGEVKWMLFPGMRGGPVELKAWATGGSWPANAMNVAASQRVLSNGGLAHNEEPAIPASELTNDYVWSWYDQLSAGFKNWVLVANPGTAPVDYQVKINGTAMDLGAYGNPGDATTGTLVAGEIDTPQFPGVRDGSVEVVATGNVLASQRVIAGPSFEETPGYPQSALASTYHWTWYDQLSPGSRNWVLIANPDTVNPVYYEVKIGANVVASGNIAAATNVTPQFPGQIGGPVRVDAWTDSGKGTPANVIATQRVVWNGYFNEVTGTVLN